MTTNLAIKQLHSRIRKSLTGGGIGKGSRIVVAVSGGPDSLTLLYALNHLRGEMGFEIHGAHLNHNLRGEASKSDARFVSDVFDRLDIAYSLQEADVIAFQKKHRMSLEEAARELRYEFLSSVAAEQSADAIALGHTSNDQAETVLMHVIRGSGLTGLRGMESRSVREINGIQAVLIRPMLDVSRYEVLEYCREMKLEPRLDESNLSTDLTRNRIRLELMPVLEQYNPAIRDALIRLSRSAAQDSEFIESRVVTEWHRMLQIEHGVLSINRREFCDLPPAIANRLLRRAISHLKGDLQDMEQNHIEEMSRLMNGKVGKSLNLPGGLTFSVGYHTATLSNPEHTPYPVSGIDGEHRIQIPGETFVSGWRVITSVVDSQAINECGDFAAAFDYDEIGNDLSVRSRKPGDRIQPLGMTHTRKIQDVMVDAKIPRSSRDNIPLVVSSKGVAWVVGCRIAHWARVKHDTTRVLALRFERR